MKNENILKLEKENGQSIVEYSILLFAVVAVMIIVINGPIREGLRGTFDGLIDAIRDSISGLIP